MLKPSSPTQSIRFLRRKEKEPHFHIFLFFSQNVKNVNFLTYSEPDSQTTCFLDVEINGEPAGRLEMALYDSIVPITAKNFQLLCENKCKPSEGKQSSVRAKGFTVDKAKFFRVVPGFCAQCGMEPISGNAANISFRDL